MDGQQRLTSLFQALASGKPVNTMDTRRKKMLRWYYIDIERALIQRADMVDAVVSVPEDRMLLDAPGRRLTDLSTPETERAAGMFPLRLVYTEERADWRWAYESIDKAHRATWKAFKSTVLKTIEGYKVPVIRLAKETPKAAVCTVFENVNTKGVQLTVFELLTATYAADNYRLPEEWAATRERLAKYDAVSDVDDTDFLRAVCLVSTHFELREQSGVDPFDLPGARCKRSDILELDLSEYLRWAREIESALEWCARFLARQGVYLAHDLPYRSQVSALAAIRVVLGDEADTQNAQDKLSRWFWCGVMGEQYSGSLDSRLDTMATRNSAAYKGVCNLLLRQECIDWVYTREPIDAAIYVDQQVDIGLIFPKAWCARHVVEESYRQNSIVNKTLLASRTRRIMGNQAPADYRWQLETETGLPGNWLDDIVGTHLIDPRLLRASDFDALYRRNSWNT